MFTKASSQVDGISWEIRLPNSKMNFLPTAVVDIRCQLLMAWTP